MFKKFKNTKFDGWPCSLLTCRTYLRLLNESYIFYYSWKSDYKTNFSNVVNMTIFKTLKTAKKHISASKKDYSFEHLLSIVIDLKQGKT